MKVLFRIDAVRLHAIFEQCLIFGENNGPCENREPLYQCQIS